MRASILPSMKLRGKQSLASSNMIINEFFLYKFAWKVRTKSRVGSAEVTADQVFALTRNSSTVPIRSTRHSSPHVIYRQISLSRRGIDLRDLLVFGRYLGQLNTQPEHFENYPKRLLITRGPIGVIAAK